jgi:hypothetical protein
MSAEASKMTPHVAPANPAPQPNPLAAPEPALEDGPLFRAHVALLEKRAHQLRQSLKKLAKALETSLVALRESLEAHAHLDETLQDLARGGAMGTEDRLGEVYERQICGARRRNRIGAEKEIERGRELGERLRSSIERLKLVEERKKDFELESKRFYEELSKVLTDLFQELLQIRSSRCFLSIVPLETRVRREQICRFGSETRRTD